MNQIFNVSINGKAFFVEFDAKTGSIKTLKNALTNVDYVNATKSDSHFFGSFVYQTYTESNFSTFVNRIM